MLQVSGGGPAVSHARATLAGVELELWAVVDEAPLYDVSTCGRVRRGDVDVPSWSNAKGYRLVSIELPTGRPALRYVHRLVLTAFADAPRGRQGNHGDGRKGHNTLDNLEWTTPAGNVAHAWATGLISRVRKPRTSCRRGHPLDQSYRQSGRTFLRCSRCRRVARRRSTASKRGQSPLFVLGT